MFTLLVVPQNITIYLDKSRETTEKLQIMKERWNIVRHALKYEKQAVRSRGHGEKEAPAFDNHPNTEGSA